jgi:hydroxymethylbilane synthase
MFVKEIEQALLDNEIDLGVHSLKDMPSELPDGLGLACVPERESPFDALIGRTAARLCDLSDGAVVGTSSTRRSAQLRHLRPDLRIEELRGNLDTRIRKLDEGQYDAIVLAAAGLNRLGWGERITETLVPEMCVPAAGQGALALEIRSDDRRTNLLLAPVHNPDSADAVAAERAFLAALGGGCSVPAGAFAQVDGNEISVVAMVAAPNGSHVIRGEFAGDRGQAAQIGAALAAKLLSEGANELLQR